MAGRTVALLGLPSGERTEEARRGKPPEVHVGGGPGEECLDPVVALLEEEDTREPSPF